MLKVNVLEFERGNENGQITAVMEDEDSTNMNEFRTNFLPAFEKFVKDYNTREDDDE